MLDEKTVFTVTETANELAISTRAVRRAVERGTLAAVPVGAFWLITREAIMTYRRDHRGRPGQSLRDDPPAPPLAKPLRKSHTPRNASQLMNVLGNVDGPEPVMRPLAPIVPVPQPAISSPLGGPPLLNPLTPALEPIAFDPSAVASRTLARTPVPPSDGLIHRRKGEAIHLKRGDRGAWVQITQDAADRRPGKKQIAAWKAEGREIIYQDNSTER